MCIASAIECSLHTKLRRMERNTKSIPLVQGIYRTTQGRKTGYVEIPFYQEQFLENTSVIRSLQALGIDIEKFWVALLFVYYLTQKKTENVMAIPAPAFDQFRAFAKYLHANPDAKIRIWRGREHGVTIESQEAIQMLGALLAENSATLYANLSRNVEFGLGDFSINLKDCYKITFVVACLLPFLEQFKAEDKRSTNPTQVSYILCS